VLYRVWGGRVCCPMCTNGLFFAVSRSGNSGLYCSCFGRCAWWIKAWGSPPPLPKRGKNESGTPAQEWSPMRARGVSPWQWRRLNQAAARSRAPFPPTTGVACSSRSSTKQKFRLGIMVFILPWVSSTLDVVPRKIHRQGPHRIELVHFVRHHPADGQVSVVGERGRVNSKGVVKTLLPDGVARSFEVRFWLRSALRGRGGFEV